MNTAQRLIIHDFGELLGRQIRRIVLSNSSGYSIEVLTLGAIWHRFCITRPDGSEQDVIVKPTELPGYLNNPKGPDYCFGASIGRYAGRIGGGGFSLDNTRYDLPGEHGVHLHGGPEGFGKKVWDILETDDGERPYVLLGVRSEDGEGGYPGTIEARCRFELAGSQCILTYYATTDRKTVLNLTNHAYFNLSDRTDIRYLALRMSSEQWLIPDALNVPTGDFRDLRDSPLDFRQGRLLREAIDYHGYIDNVFVLDWDEKQGRFARLTDPDTGLQLTVRTNQPSVVVFAPDRLVYEGPLSTEITEYPAICFETQNFPDAPNKSHFPDSSLEEDQVYFSRTHFDLRFARDNASLVPCQPETM